MLPESPKVCTKCGRLLTIECFSRDAQKKDGRRFWCRECAAESKRLYRETHRDELAEDHRRYYEEHRDELTERRRLPSSREARAEYTRLYRQGNADRINTACRNRRARKKNAAGTHTLSDIAAQYGRQRGRCYWCEKRVGDDYHVDHVIPLILGGSNGPENIVIACPLCNQVKHAKHPMEFAGRLC